MFIVQLLNLTALLLHRYYQSYTLRMEISIRPDGVFKIQHSNTLYVAQFN